MADQLVVGNSGTKHVSAVRGNGITIGVEGNAEDGWGVVGRSKKQVGVRGVCDDGWGVAGESKNQVGVRGACDPGWGVAGTSKNGLGVLGECETGAGVMGSSKSADGVFGKSATGRGVVGVAESATAVEGNSKSGAGVFASSEAHIGVHAKGGRLAALFEGDVEVTGDIRLTNADCAEDFEVEGHMGAEPGTVMVLSAEASVRPSARPYDTRVVGVISGAGDFRPGLILDRQSGASNRSPVALLGKVFCKVDATDAPIAVGDLLTTSATPGHAMRATDPHQSFGAVIGKALREHRGGQGMIPILITLQ